MLPLPPRILWLVEEVRPALLRRAVDERGRQRVERLRRFRPPRCADLREKYGQLASPPNRSVAVES